MSSEESPGRTRRQVLAAAGGLCVSGLAGCSASADDGYVVGEDLRVEIGETETIKDISFSGASGQKSFGFSTEFARAVDRLNIIKGGKLLHSVDVPLGATVVDVMIHTDNFGDLSWVVIDDEEILETVTVTVRREE